MLLKLAEHVSVLDSLCVCSVSFHQDMGKIEAGMMDEIECSPCALDFIQDSVMFCKPFATLCEVRLETEVPGGEDSMIMGNSLKMQQVLTNLISNSIKYTDMGTSVTVTAKACSLREAWNEMQNSYSDLESMDPSVVLEEKLRMESTPSQRVTVISVRDEGRGVPDKEKHKVFGKYIQLEISYEKEREYDPNGARIGQSIGSGLGLHLAKNYINGMGGHIWFRNCEPNGVEFCFYLLNSKTSPVQQTRHDDAAEPLELSSLEAEPLRVMLVDDSMINIKVVSRMLSRAGIKDMHVFSGAAQALKFLHEEATTSENTSQFPNVIMTDLQMPEIDGFQFMEKLRD
ncbi:MAG: hypothetical protein SGILL_005168, partial [Bacillariaceae sp.]